MFLSPSLFLHPNFQGKSLAVKENRGRKCSRENILQLSPLEVILRGKTGIVSTPDDYWVAGYFLGRCNKKKSRDRICSSCATDRIHCRTKKIVGVRKDKIGFFLEG